MHRRPQLTNLVAECEHFDYHDCILKCLQALQVANGDILSHQGEGSTFLLG